MSTWKLRGMHALLWGKGCTGSCDEARLSVRVGDDAPLSCLLTVKGFEGRA